MKRGFLNNPKGLGDPRSNWHPFRKDASERLGSATGIPTSETMAGLSWVPVTDELRQRWTTPWELVAKEDTSDMMEEDDTTSSGATMMSTQPSISMTQADSSPMKLHGQPYLPHKTMDVPKNALDTWYQKEFRFQIVTGDSYFTWHNDGMPHERKFTSIFVCPITAEVFGTGTYGPKKYYTLQVDPVTGATIVWFNDKASAQHGAASRAYDCFSLRKYTPLGMQSVRLGGDEQHPYMQEQDAPKLPSMPHDICNKMEAQRGLIATRRTQSASISSPVAPKQVLGTWYNMSPRSHQLSKNSFVSWRDDAMPHLVKFTCVFVCPLSGEVFASGRHGNSEAFEERTDLRGRTVFWYNKKAMAEHAAAARAYDCWCVRLEGRTLDFLGRDTPYKSQADAPPLPTLPCDVSAKVESLRTQAKTPIVMQPQPPMPTEEEIQVEREEYRSARLVQQHGEGSMPGIL